MQGGKKRGPDRSYRSIGRDILGQIGEGHILGQTREKRCIRVKMPPSDDDIAPSVMDFLHDWESVQRVRGGNYASSVSCLEEAIERIVRAMISRSIIFTLHNSVFIDRNKATERLLSKEMHQFSCSPVFDPKTQRISWVATIRSSSEDSILYSTTITSNPHSKLEDCVEDLWVKAQELLANDIQDCEREGAKIERDFKANHWLVAELRHTTAKLGEFNPSQTILPLETK